VFGYAHLALYPALAAVGVGVKLAIEGAIDPAAGEHAAVVVGVGVAAYLASLSAIQAAAPRGLAARTLLARGVTVAWALALGLLDLNLSPALAVALVAAPVCALVATGD
jgi:low temperature requirement protein LtrA